MEFKIYTDGGCSGNKRDAGCQGAWAFIILDPAGVIIHNDKGIEYNTTNNRMEMTAVIKALEQLKASTDIFYNGSNIHDCIVMSDSQYVVNNFEDYIQEWKSKNWIKRKGEEVINSDLWKQIDILSQNFKSFKFKWIKGHSTDQLNQAVDIMVKRILY